MSSEQRNLARRVAGVTTPIHRKRMRYSRNFPCLCGSGKKYKKCCLLDIESVTEHDDNAKTEPLSPEISKLINQIQEDNKRKGKNNV